MDLLKELLENNYSLVCSNGYKSLDSGIKPIITKLNEDLWYFKGEEVADKIIGKAAAMLFVLSGVKKVNAVVMSKGGQAILEKYHIEYSYQTLCDSIINRKGDDICPMEKTVKDIDDLNEAYLALKEKV